MKKAITIGQGGMGTHEASKAKNKDVLFSVPFIRSRLLSIVWLQLVEPKSYLERGQKLPDKAIFCHK